MSQRLRGMAAGMSAQEASNVCTGATNTGLTATGTTSQANSYALPANTNALFSTVSSNNGARLPYAGDSGPIYIFNGGGSTLLLYPASGQTINAIAADSSFSVTSAKGCMCFPLTTGWAVILSA